MIYHVYIRFLYITYIQNTWYIMYHTFSIIYQTLYIIYHISYYVFYIVYCILSIIPCISYCTSFFKPHRNILENSKSVSKSWFWVVMFLASRQHSSEWHRSEQHWRKPPMLPSVWKCFPDCDTNKPQPKKKYIVHMWYIVIHLGIIIPNIEESGNQMKIKVIQIITRAPNGRTPNQP